MDYFLFIYEIYVLLIYSVQILEIFIDIIHNYSMFSSLKVKLQSFLNPFQRRSASICVQSKAKKIQSKRELSQKKNNDHPQQIEITPKKRLSKDKNMYSFDEMDTAIKEHFHHPSATRIFQNRNNSCNQKWLDFVSDIDSNGAQSDNLLLPNQSQLNQKSNRIDYINKLNINRVKQNFRDNLPLEFNQIQVNGQTQSVAKPDNEMTLINQLQDNKPIDNEVKFDKQNQESKYIQHNILASEIKKKRRLQYQKEKHEQAKGCRLACIVCEQQAVQKDSIHLTCAHRIHKYCAQLIKWKPRMKCAKCQRKSIKDLIFLRGNSSAKQRRSIEKRERK